MGKIDGLMGDIDKLMLNVGVDAGESYPPIPPVGKIQNFPFRIGWVRQHVPKHPFGQQTGLHPAIGARKKPVRFFQNGRCTALGTLMVDLNVDSWFFRLRAGNRLSTCRTEPILHGKAFSASTAGR